MGVGEKPPTRDVQLFIFQVFVVEYFWGFESTWRDPQRRPVDGFSLGMPMGCQGGKDDGKLIQRYWGFWWFDKAVLDTRLKGLCFHTFSPSPKRSPAGWPGWQNPWLTWPGFCRILLLMIEILHQLGCKKDRNKWDKLPTSTGASGISEPSTAIHKISNTTRDSYSWGAILSQKPLIDHPPSCHFVSRMAANVCGFFLGGVVISRLRKPCILFASAVGCWRGEACAFGHSFEMMEKKCRRPRKETREKIKEIRFSAFLFCLEMGWPGFGEVQFPWCFCLRRFGCFGCPESLGGILFDEELFPPPGVVMRNDCEVDWDFIMEDRWVVFFPGIVREIANRIVDAKFCISWWRSQSFFEKSWDLQKIFWFPPISNTFNHLCSKKDSLKFLKIDTSQFHRTTTDHQSVTARSAFACALSSTSIRIPGQRGQGRYCLQMGFQKTRSPDFKDFVKRLLPPEPNFIKGPYVGLWPRKS